MNNLTILGIRLFALFVLLRAMVSLEFIPTVLLDEYFKFSDSWHFFLVSGVYLIISVILFTKSKAIASFITPKSKDSELEFDDYQKLAAVVFSTVGLLIIYWSVQGLFQSFASIVNMNMMYPDNPDMPMYRTTVIVFGGLIQMIIGLLLFVGGKKLAQWWYNFRNWT